MKRRVIVIGIGAGDPEHLTVQAIRAMNQASVLFIPTKGEAKDGLAQARRDICERYLEGDKRRIVEFETPDRAKPDGPYRQGVETWRDAVERVYERLLADELGDTDCGAFLIWGDPAIYDGTIRILDAINARGALEVEFEVVPGISSVQALAARHRVALNGIGESILVTTGRRMAGGMPDGAENVVVMLDPAGGLDAVDDATTIHWGAFVGTPDEILLSGRVGDLRAEIERVRRDARQRHGWIMDSYLLRRPTGPGKH